MPVALDHMQAVALDGRVYYVGGLESFLEPAVGSVYVYDPATNSFSTGAPMPTGRERGAAGIAVHAGKIYVAGGLHAGSAVPWFDVYDPATNTWASLPDLPRARDHFHAAVVGNRFYAIGGRNRHINATTTANDAFDFNTMTWITGLAPLPTARGGFGAAVLGTRILLIGGETSEQTYATVEEYDPASNTWSTLPPMFVARHGIQAAVCAGGVYVAGGGTRPGGGAPTKAHEVFMSSAYAPCEPPHG